MPRPFAHLLGLGRPAAGKPKGEEEDDDKKRDDDTSAKGADEGEDEDDDKKRDDDTSAKGKKAADDDSGDENDDESMSEEDEDEKKGKKAEDDDSDDKEDRKDAKATAARRRERARCAAIFASKHAASRPDMAAHYAFATNLTRREARSALAAVAAGQPSAAGGGLMQRMSGMDRIRPGAGGPPSKPGPASSWDASAKRVGLLRS